MFLLLYPNKELRRISNRRPVYGNRVDLLKSSADGGEKRVATFQTHCWRELTFWMILSQFHRKSIRNFTWEPKSLAEQDHCQNFYWTSFRYLLITHRNIYPFQPIVACHIETLFYTKCDTDVKWVKVISWAIKTSDGPTGNYMFKVNNRNTRPRPGVVLVFLLLTLNIFHTLF